MSGSSSPASMCGTSTAEHRDRRCALDVEDTRPNTAAVPSDSSAHTTTKYRPNIQLEGHSSGGAHVPPTKVFRRLTASMNETTVKPRFAVAVGRKTILKPRFAAATNTYTSDFPDIKFCVAWLMTAEKAVRFRHPDYNPDRAQKLISSSMSRHLSTRNISSKSMHAVLSNLANRQTDRQTQANAFTSFVGGKYRPLI